MNGSNILIVQQYSYTPETVVMHVKDKALSFFAFTIAAANIMPRCACGMDFNSTRVMCHGVYVCVMNPPTHGFS